MEIIWNISEGKNGQNPIDNIELEYHLRLQVVKAIITQAEHLMDYLHLIVLEVKPDTGSVSVHEDTPQPLFSIVQNNLEPKVFRNGVAQTSQTSVKKALLAIS